MSRHDPRLASAPIVIWFETQRAAERKVAGMSVAGRVAAETCRAGFQNLVLVLGDSSRPSPSLRQDIIRGCGDAEITFVSRADLPARPIGGHYALVVSGNHVISAPLLHEFAESTALHLTHGGSLLAAKTVPGQEAEWLTSTYDESGMEANGADVIALDNRRARSQILLLTAKETDGVIARVFNRPVSRRISAILLAVPALRPWHLTMATAVVAIAMFIALLIGTAPALMAGGLLFQAASILDGVDGEMARATFRSSRGGATLDTAVDMATNFLFYVGLTVGGTRLYGPSQAYIGAWTVVMAVIGLSTMTWLVRRLGRPESFDILKIHYRRIFPVGPPRLIVETLVMLTSRDSFAFACAAMLLVGMGRTAAWLLAIFATLWVLLIVLAFRGLLDQEDWVDQTA